MCLLPNFYLECAFQKLVIAFITLLARRLILFKWKQHTEPSFSHWVKDVMYILKVEKKKYQRHSQRILKIWRPFLDYDSLYEPLDNEQLVLFYLFIFAFIIFVFLYFIFPFLFNRHLVVHSVSYSPSVFCNLWVHEWVGQSGMGREGF